MSKPKTLPKRRDGAFTYQAHRYVDVVRVLAQCNNIDMTESFCSMIENAIRNYHVFAARDSAITPIDDQRQRFIAMRDCAAALRECLTAMSTDEKMQLRRQDRLDDDVMDHLDECLLFMGANADAALSRLVGHKSKAGRKINIAFIEFIDDLHQIYVKATGRTDWFTRPIDGEEITGNFVEFLKAVLPAISIEKIHDRTLSEYLTAAKKKELL